MSAAEDRSKLFDVAMAGAETAEDRAEVWHAFLEGNAGHLNSRVEEIREELSTGTPADAIRLSSEDVGAKAVEAARQFRHPEDRYGFEG